MMKAAVVTANETVEYQEIAEPQVEPGCVKIRVKVSGICGSDVPRVLHNGVHFYPIVLGHEFSGEIVELGEGVERLRVGDRVSCAPLMPCMKCDDCQRGDYSLCRNYSFIGSRRQGGNADYVVIPARNAVPFDAGIPYEQGAMFEPSTVALHGVLCNAFAGGGTVAILGGGTVGIFTMQWAKLLGAGKTVVFDIAPGRLALAKKLGADGVVNTTEDAFLEKAMALTGGIGFDYVFETAGAVPTMRMAYQVAANHAHVCFIGTPHADLTFTPPQWENLNRKELRATASWMSYSAPFPGKEWSMTAEYYARGLLKVDPDMIGERFPMARAQEAFLRFKTPGAVTGKILLYNESISGGARNGTN